MEMLATQATCTCMHTADYGLLTTVYELQTGTADHRLQAIVKMKRRSSKCLLFPDKKGRVDKSKNQIMSHTVYIHVM